MQGIDVPEEAYFWPVELLVTREEEGEGEGEGEVEDDEEEEESVDVRCNK